MFFQKKVACIIILVIFIQKLLAVKIIGNNKKYDPVKVKCSIHYKHLSFVKIGKIETEIVINKYALRGELVQQMYTVNEVDGITPENTSVVVIYTREDRKKRLKMYMFENERKPLVHHGFNPETDKLMIMFVPKMGKQNL